MTQRGLRIQCNVPKHDQIPLRNTTVVWVLQPYLLRNTRPSISVCVCVFFFYAQRNVLPRVVLRSHSQGTLMV